MGDVAIRAEGLGKRYRIGAKQKRYSTLRERMAAMGRLLLRRGEGRGEKAAIWALKDVSFEVKRGEVLGIVGRNGAGKSTLLKILTRITEPTEGYAALEGRVASLLEVGTGFHPELTGRENVYLNGAILGMRKVEIDGKFDDIVDFSGIEKFIDTPVKHYSSGMYVRLAFAVAAHLQPEILLVDEVLAVGDAEFQKKCLGRMGDVAGSGRTVLFVSHSMNAITRLCHRCLWLDGGRVQAILPAGEAVRKYLASGVEPTGEASFPLDPGMGAQFLVVRLLDEKGKVKTEFASQEPIHVEMTVQVREPLGGAYLTMSIHSPEGVPILFSEERETRLTRDVASMGVHTLRVTVPGNLLAPGEFLVNVGIASSYLGKVYHNPKGVCALAVQNYLSSRLSWPALIAPSLKWESAVPPERMGADRRVSAGLSSDGMS